MVPRQRRDLLRVVGDEDGAPQLGLGGLLVQLEQHLARPPARLHVHAVVGGHGGQLLHRRAHVDPHPGVALHQAGHGGPLPRRGQVELAPLVGEAGGADHLGGQVGHQVLGEAHHVAVVGVGLVQLEHGELGVVAGGQPLVAEHPTDLEDALEAPHHQALQVQLRGDAQVELDVEGVVVGGEGLGQRPAGDGVQHRGLHLHEPPVLQPAPGQAHHLAAQGEGPPRPVVGPQVDVALAVAQVGVGDAAPLVAEAPAGAGQQLPAGHLHRQLAATGLHHLTGGAHPVPERQAHQVLEALGALGQGEQLHGAGGVAQLGEGQAPLVAQQHHPAGHGDGHARLLAGLEAVEVAVQRRRRAVGLEAVGDAHGEGVRFIS